LTTSSSRTPAALAVKPLVAPVARLANASRSTPSTVVTDATTCSDGLPLIRATKSAAFSSALIAMESVHPVPASSIVPSAVGAV
jgi:hypothetical protein